MSTPAEPEDASDAQGEDASEPEVTLPTGWRAVGKGSDRVQTVDEPDDDDDEATHFAGDDETPLPATNDADDEPEGLTFSNAALLGIGIFAGIYLMYTIGWYIVGNNLSAIGGVVLGSDFLMQVLRWAAVFAPFVWFFVTFALTLHSRAIVRFAWLAAGALLLVPWPMFGGAA